MMTFGFGGFGMLFGFLFWIVIAGLIVWALAQALPRITASNNGTTYPTTPSGTNNAPQDAFALEILKQRFARGEITREEYEAMRQELAV